MMPGVAQKSANVLCLDGGGVRGLSTLIILEELMTLVRSELGDESVTPKDVFDLIVGTSTGGLIALMLVKLNLSVEQCIEKYRLLSTKIFGHWHLFGYFSGGFGNVTKFSSRRFRRILVREVIEPALVELHGTEEANAEQFCMEHVDNHIHRACAVVCREIETNDSILLCSHRDNVITETLCTHRCRVLHSENNPDSEHDIVVADAAIATAAAPTYFQKVQLMGKSLVDGGFGRSNNPSFVVWDHYFGLNKSHYKHINLVNIGTGTEPKGFKAKQGWMDWCLDKLPGTWLKNMMNTMEALLRLATESEGVAKMMEAMVSFGDRDLLKFNRFSADRGGIHTIKLFEHSRLDEIDELTKDYLNDEEVQRRLKRVAVELAATLEGRRRQQIVQPEPTEPSTQSLPKLQTSLYFQSSEEAGGVLEAPGMQRDLSNASSVSHDLPRTPVSHSRIGGLPWSQKDGADDADTQKSPVRSLTARW